MENAPPQPPPVLAATPPAVDSSDKILCILPHLSLFFGAGIILPLILYLVKKKDSPVVAEHSRAALNFHLSVALYSLVCVILSCAVIGFFLLIPLAIGALVLSVIAAVEASNGGFYRYPLCLRLVP